jgi:hypothetical protein
MTITGYCYLPSAYPSHPHATERARQIAREGLIFMAEVGSGVHGIAIDSASDDTDYMGLTVEPPECVTGLETFDQFQRHTAWDRQGGLRERSGRGDCDYLVYGLKKFCRLALAGNPSILNLLFVPESAVVTSTIFSDELLENASWFISQQAAGRYLGYLHRQRLGMTGEAGAKVKRPELVERFGYDVKYASHALRLGFQGVELLTTGRITLPMPEKQREMVLEIKRGEATMEQALHRIDAVEKALQYVADNNSLPDRPDYTAVNWWLHATYLERWATG